MGGLYVQQISHRWGTDCAQPLTFRYTLVHAALARKNRILSCWSGFADYFGHGL
ncbi:hypothetical protein C4J93_0683 [Pseudomonas sp. R2-37-08W]|nr:hypothetical protein C4J93_0683 [Pseudomonas sp. R2-37-08W]